MRALLHDQAVLEDDDEIGIPDGGQAVRDDERGAVGKEHAQREDHAQGEEDAQNKGSIAETDLDVAGGLNHLAIRRDQPQTIDRVGDGDVADLIVLIADHRSEVSFVD